MSRVLELGTNFAFVENVLKGIKRIYVTEKENFPRLARQQWDFNRYDLSTTEVLFRHHCDQCKTGTVFDFPAGIQIWSTLIGGRRDKPGTDFDFPGVIAGIQVWSTLIGGRRDKPGTNFDFQGVIAGIQVWSI